MFKKSPKSCMMIDALPSRKEQALKTSHWRTLQSLSLFKNSLVVEGDLLFARHFSVCVLYYMRYVYAHLSFKILKLSLFFYLYYFITEGGATIKTLSSLPLLFMLGNVLF